MNENETAEKDFLHELYRQTDGNMDTQVSMYDVGAALGLDKSHAGELAENLIYQGFVELRTLSGGISLCKEALELLGLQGSGGPESEEHLLSQATAADTDDIALINDLITAIKQALPEIPLAYEGLEEAILDLKCIELQLLSPSPKTAVIRELFRSLHTNTKTAGPADLTGRLARQL